MLPDRETESGLLRPFKVGAIWEIANLQTKIGPGDGDVERHGVDEDVCSFHNPLLFPTARLYERAPPRIRTDLRDTKPPTAWINSVRVALEDQNQLIRVSLLQGQYPEGMPRGTIWDALNY
jgi:hypothetical protein